jgi:hypothetical protein
MSETPQEMAARADRVMARCRERGQASSADLSDMANLRDAIHVLAEECMRLGALHGELTDEFGILDDGKPMEIDGKSQVLLLNAGQARAAIEVRAKDIFAVGARRPARLMQRLVTGWQEIPGDGARGVDQVGGA